MTTLKKLEEMFNQKDACYVFCVDDYKNCHFIMDVDAPYYNKKECLTTELEYAMLFCREYAVKIALLATILFDTYFYVINIETSAVIL